MNNHHQGSIFIVIATMIVAVLLSIMPFPYWAEHYRPAWVTMTLIYWTVAMPFRVNLGIAFCFGILLDALHGSVFGMHALGLLCVAFLAAKFYLQIQHYSAWQKALVLGLLVLLYQFILLLLYGSIGKGVNFRYFWYPAVTSMLLWPLFFIILRDIQTRFRLR